MVAISTLRRFVHLYPILSYTLNISIVLSQDFFFMFNGMQLQCIRKFTHLMIYNFVLFDWVSSLTIYMCTMLTPTMVMLLDHRHKSMYLYDLIWPIHKDPLWNVQQDTDVPSTRAKSTALIGKHLPDREPTPRRPFRHTATTRHFCPPIHCRLLYLYV